MTDIKYGGMMCPHGHVKAACAICATPPKSPPMTDPKPATPATDDPLVRYGIEWRDQRSPICAPMADGYWTPWHLAQERIAADAETIKTERARADKYEAESEQKGADLMAAEGTIEDLKAAAALANAIIGDNDATRTIRDLRETIRKQAEEIERLKGDNAQWKDLHDKCHPAYERAAAELATLRSQVETLREALEIARKIIYTKTWDTDQHALDAMAAALAATEPKG